MVLLNPARRPLSVALLGLVAFSVASPSCNSAISPTRSCKCTYPEPCWPPESDFAALSRRLSAPLISVHPPAYPCHDPHFSTSLCDEVHTNWGGALWRSDQPGASESANFEASDDLADACLLNATRTTECGQGRVPVVGVNATTVEDVVEAVRFAAQWNLKLVVKNTGHDFLGRGFSAGSFMIWTHEWKYMNFTGDFTPIGGNTTNQPAVTIGPGVQWRELYEFAQSQNTSIAGGIGPQGSVGAGGGWPLGGGHNILSPTLGLGVDNVLELTVVTANGTQLTANAYKNPSLFWALRGGGGPSFGIVTSLTYRLHPIAPLYAYFFEAKLASNATFMSVMTSWHIALPAIADAGWSGYYPFTPGLFALQYILPNGNASAANATLGRWLDGIVGMDGVNVTTSVAIEYPSLTAWVEANILHPEHAVGFNYTGGAASMGNSFAPASWLLPRTLFENETTAEAISAAFSNFSAGGLGQHVGGGVVSQVDPDAMGVHPAWRTCLVDIATSGAWSEGTLTSVIADIRRSISSQIDPLRALTPGPLYAQYLNEPDILEPRFQAANWGAHYPRLQEIKREYDPEDLFVVPQGVNSECWDSAQVCRI